MNRTRIRALSGLLTILVMILVPAAPALADGFIIPEPPPNVPIVEVPYLTVKYHHVTVTIEDQVATTHVDQVFVNEGRFEVEGTYLFPLPEAEQATVSQFSMWVEGQKLGGQVLKREEARQIYEEIVRQRRDPALLEYVGRDAFQASIFPIPAGAERRIELEYSQVLPLDNGLVEYVYPLNTEKFSPRPLGEVSVTVAIHSKGPLKAIYSPSHDVAVDRRGDHNADVGYEETDVRPDRDFVLYYTVSAEDVGVNLLSYRPQGSEDGFFLLLAAPKVEVAAQRIVARDVILVLDVSGSMRGEKLEQAKAALSLVLDNLNAEDRFGLLSFSTSTQAYSRSLVAADERGEARDFVARLEAGGSTDINRALLEALSMADEERPTVLVMLTDGLPTTGEVDVDRIIANVAEASPEQVRIFPFGVGYDVNTFLLDTIAENQRGASGYVRPEESIDEQVSAFWAKVSTPLLSDLAIDFGSAEVDDVYPYPLPDLFAGTQLVVMGRYSGGGETAITLSGQVNGQAQTFRYDSVTFRDGGGEEFIARLWATRKIGYLLQQIRLHGEDKELVDEIVDLSVRYGIVTPYTSFLVEETEQALREAGREAIAHEALATAAPLPASGQSAVERSAVEKALSGAQAAPAATVSVDAGTGGATDEYGNAISPVRYVGDKTFILRNGAWTDTTFDPDKVEPVPVSLGSDDYFGLVATHPQWGRYFALGDHVIVVLDGTAYEIRDQGAWDEEQAAKPGAGEGPSVEEDRSGGRPQQDTPGGVLETVLQAIRDWIERVIDRLQ